LNPGKQNEKFAKKTTQKFSYKEQQKEQKLQEKQSNNNDNNDNRSNNNNRMNPDGTLYKPV
jgi:hypothetical protein